MSHYHNTNTSPLLQLVVRLMLSTCSLLLAGVAVAVHPQYVVRDLPVLLGVHLIQHDEEEVETRQQGVLEANVLHGGLILVVLQRDGVTF